jgi:AcrR family transcriptional regulator
MVEESGEGALGVRDLARRLGLSPGALYRYYDGRDAIVSTLAAESMALLGERLRAAATGADPLGSVGLAYLAFAAEEPARFRLLFVDRPSSRRTLGDSPDAESPYRIVLSTARQAIADGLVAPDLDAESISYTLWSLVHGMAVLEATHLRGFDADFSQVHRVALQHLTTSWGPKRP